MPNFEQGAIECGENRPPFQKKCEYLGKKKRPFFSKSRTCRLLKNRPFLREIQKGLQLFFRLCPPILNGVDTIFFSFSKLLHSLVTQLQFQQPTEGSLLGTTGTNIWVDQLTSRGRYSRTSVHIYICIFTQLYLTNNENNTKVLDIWMWLWPCHTQGHTSQFTE